MMSFSEERKTFVHICRRAVTLGMQTSTGGNLSMRLGRGRFLVKPSGSSLFDLSEEALLIVDQTGEVIEGHGKPTKEINTHMAIYMARKDARGVVHYHPPYSTAFAVCNMAIPLETVHGKRILKSIPVVPFGKEGSDSLASSVGKAFSHDGVYAALLSGHGMIAAGRDLPHAQNLAELLEESAKIAYLGYALSKTGLRL